MYSKGEVEIDKAMFTDDLVIQLPHSCDYWVIGTPAEARLLIADLETAIVEWERITNGPV